MTTAGGAFPPFFWRRILWALTCWPRKATPSKATAVRTRMARRELHDIGVLPPELGSSQAHGDELWPGRARKNSGTGRTGIVAQGAEDWQAESSLAASPCGGEGQIPAAHCGMTKRRW